MFGRSKSAGAKTPKIEEVREDVKTISSDEELIAVLTAAINAYEGNGQHAGRNIKVVSYRHIGPVTSVWNNKARAEYLR